jgi:hypothetical protein
MTFTAQELQEHAAALGFRPDSLEKVYRLLHLLEALRSHAFLRPRLALKGGTALNLFVFDVPRLSVDIDLNYVGSAARDEMLADRPKIEQALRAVCSRERLLVKHIPGEHAGGKWRLSFTNASGSSDRLEIDLNFMLRVPLWPVHVMDSKPVGPVVATGIAVVDPHELAAGKLAALCARNASRDVFDARELLAKTDFDRAKLRLAFVVYGGMNRKDWRTVRAGDIAVEPIEASRELVPMLRSGFGPEDGGIAAWVEALVADTRDLMRAVLPLSEAEIEFLDRLNDAGEIAAELLTGDAAMQDRIGQHPGLKWKALNVKQRTQGLRT